MVIGISSCRLGVPVCGFAFGGAFIIATGFDFGMLFSEDVEEVYEMVSDFNDKMIKKGVLND